MQAVRFLKSNIENFVFYSNKPNKKGTFAKIPAPAPHTILDDLKEKKLSKKSFISKLISYFLIHLLF